MTVWMFAGSAAVLALAVLIAVGLWKLHRLMRDADRDQRLADQLVYRYGQGTSLSWAGPDNDEDPAAAKHIRVSAANPHVKE